MQSHAHEGTLVLLAQKLSDWFISVGLMTRIMPRHAEDERLFLNKKYMNRYGEGYVLHKYFAKYLLYSAIIIYYNL